MVEDNPRMNELDEMVQFISSCKEWYIYGHDTVQKMLSKYLFFSKLPISGFVMPEVRACDKDGEPFPILTLPELAKKVNKRRIGVIIPTEDNLYNQVIDTLKLIGITKIHLLSEWNKRTIVKKMMPRCIDDFFLEVNLADHCNLNCQCCDHFSPIASENYLDFDQYVKDIKRIAELTNHTIGLMKLQGGEPLLNTRVLDFMEVTREVFPESRICLFTDGLLLPKWSKKGFWEVVKKCAIEVRMTQYPITLNLDEIVKSATEHDIPVTFDPPAFDKSARLWIFSEIGALNYKGIKHSVKHPFDLSGKQKKHRWISCYQFNESIVLRDGKIYTCPMIPYVHYFNEYFQQNLIVEDDCYIDIYKANSFFEIADFCTARTSFCDYCAVHKRSSREWKQSEHTMDEWVL